MSEQSVSPRPEEATDDSVEPTKDGEAIGNAADAPTAVVDDANDPDAQQPTNSL